MSSTMTYTGVLEITSCHCGVTFAVPDNLMRQARESGTTLYCPLGHKFVFRKSEVDRLKEEKMRLQSAVEAGQRREARERDERRAVERRLVAQKGATTKAKKRHAAALCPCCNRSFVQLRRHLEMQHPDYDGSLSS
jgi:hypothetical protein